MRLGKKKEKDKEAEIRSVDGIIRLICLSKGQAPLKGWLNIKLIIERISDGFGGMAFCLDFRKSTMGLC